MNFIQLEDIREPKTVADQYLRAALLKKFNAQHDVLPSGCWIWTGRGKGWYGQLEGIPAHKLSWALFKTDTEVPHQVRMACSNHPCVNPDHLYDPRTHTLQQARKALNMSHP